MSKTSGKSPGTCVDCMGRGTRSETKTKTVWSVDEKGLPCKDTHVITALVRCTGCEGKGVR